MQIIDIAHFLQHRLSEFEAVGDGEGLHHIEHGVVDIAVAALADPTDQIRGVLRLGEIFCRGTGGPLVERANTEEPLGWRLVKASA